jgi:hypothetical protein
VPRAVHRQAQADTRCHHVIAVMRAAQYQTLLNGMHVMHEASTTNKTQLS